MQNKKLTDPGTLRSFPRSALGVSTGVLSVPVSTSSTDPGTLLIPTPALDAKTVVVEPDDPDGLPSIAVAQVGSGGYDGLKVQKKRTSKPVMKDRGLGYCYLMVNLLWITRELMDHRLFRSVH